MWANNLLLIVIGIGSGMAIAAGVFALITKVGVIPQIADVTHTAAYVTTYEMAILAGALFGNYVTIFSISLSLPTWVMGIFGIFSGIFVGCLATALAESLNVTAIFTRRLRLHTGIAWIVLSMALGKIFGSLIYFFRGYSP
ncbi:MAG: stage V sporulation protein AB [Lachnospiraceae bacterium]|nr:stage V sporulation protein AB [Lachnospiraceae bacterium]